MQKRPNEQFNGYCLDRSIARVYYLTAESLF